MESCNKVIANETDKRSKANKKPCIPQSNRPKEKGTSQFNSLQFSPFISSLKLITSEFFITRKC